MSENKRANIPVASHGLHKHDYNYPWLGSLNFCEVLPCYVNTLRHGEKDNPKAGVFSQLMPIAHNAFVTGRYNFKCIYVPYNRVWRPYSYFAQSTEYHFSNASIGQQGSYFGLVDNYPYVLMSELNDAIVSVDYATHVQATDPADFLYSDGRFFKFTDKGRRVFKILVALGLTPNFVVNDDQKLNIINAMCYIKAFADYYFPNQYVNNKFYKDLAWFFNTEVIHFDATKLLTALDTCSLGYYDGSFFENCWDNPVTPNVLSSVPSVHFNDPTFDSSNSNVDKHYEVSPDGDAGTPIAQATVDDGDVVGFSQYVINSLRSLSMWLKRKQLSGARLLDRYLVSRGIPIDSSESDMSFFMGQRNIEIQTSGVENNSDTNLGELAGRAVASSGNEPLEFRIRADQDGCVLVIVQAVPDATFPVYLDGFSVRTDVTTMYNAEFDKMGPVDVPTKLVGQSVNSGVINQAQLPNIFGFAQNYWDEIQERPRLLGDFILASRGSTELSAYHSFRLFNWSTAYLAHSYEFIRQDDQVQYQRFFYSEDQDNLMLFMRWFGSQYKEKLPLGDSYEWDDDENNRRVNLVVGGSQK